MKTRNLDHRPARAAFTLLELVVVLAILALVTTLAFQSLDQVEDQRRYEASRQMLTDLEKAVLGDGDIAGFVSDMGRLPEAVLVSNPKTSLSELALAELWTRTLPTETLPVHAVIRNTAIDPEVVVPAGWRGPYLSLPMDAWNILDGWGNPMRSLPTPVAPGATDDYRLRDSADSPITSEGAPVCLVRHLGADGAPGSAGGPFDQDFAVTFESASLNQWTASVSASVQLVERQERPAPVNGTVIVRAFYPDPADPSLLSVESQSTSVTIPLGSDPWSIVVNSTLAGLPGKPLSIGQRAVRAYLYEGDPATTAPTARSTIKHVTLRPGVNFIPLTIYR